MTDVFAPEQRSRIMSRVRQRDTRPEIALRKALTSLGIRYRLHRRDLPGCPDIVIPSKRTAVLVHGCFWHGHAGCSRAARPTTRTEFWNRKIDANIARDLRVRTALVEAGWTVLVFWGCETRDGATLEARLRVALDGGRP